METIGMKDSANKFAYMGGEGGIIVQWAFSNLFIQNTILSVVLLLLDSEKEVIKWNNDL